MKKETKSTEQEKAAMMECIEEAFWSRSVPAGILSGSLALWALKTGKLKMKSRFGGIWPAVAGFGSLGYILGKISYIVGEQCMDIFLEKAPESSISYNVRRRREEEGDIELPNRFMDILHQVHDDEMSDVELGILDDCNNVAFYRYSLPLSILSGGAMFLAMKKNLLNESKLIQSFPKLPKISVGLLVGYLAGQYYYVKSADCARRFQRFNPDGNISMLLRGDSGYYCEECARSEENHVQQYSFGSSSTTEGYLFPPTDILMELEEGIKANWSNSFDPQLRP